MEFHSSLCKIHLRFTVEQRERFLRTDKVTTQVYPLSKIQFTMPMYYAIMTQLKLCSFVWVPSLFKKEINAFDSLRPGLVTVLSVDVNYGNTLMILIERNFELVLWIL